MAGSASIDVSFKGALARRVDDVGAYLARPGFWHGGAGIAAPVQVASSSQLGSS